MSLIERGATRLLAAINRSPEGKRWQERFLRSVTYSWVRAALAQRMLVEGLDDICALSPDRGVIFASNHRTFFDLYAMMLALWMGPTPWAKNLYFPIRSTFFYDHPLGVIINLLIAAGTMYPPVFRDPKRRGPTREGFGELAVALQHPGNLVGIHPEGRRHVDGDPYSMLPAQPGVGELAAKARSMIVPVFINGLSNDFVFEVFRAGRQPNVRRDNPCICVFGKPLMVDELGQGPARPALYKDIADQARDAILKLSQREKQLRQDCRAGTISESDRLWLDNRGCGLFYARHTAAGLSSTA